MKNSRYFAYALVITIVITIVSWIEMFDSSRSGAHYHNSYGGSSRSWGGGSGGHK